jgi:hypothetical protein
MINPYGCDPLLAAFMGFYPGTGPDVRTRAAYSCSLERLAVGLYAFKSNTSVNDNNGLFQVRAVGAGGASLEIDASIIYSNTGLSTTIAFTSNVGGVATPADPTGLFTITLYNCTDGVTNIFGNP